MVWPSCIYAELIGDGNRLAAFAVIDSPYRDGLVMLTENDLTLASGRREVEICCKTKFLSKGKILRTILCLENPADLLSCRSKVLAEQGDLI